MKTSLLLLSFVFLNGISSAQSYLVSGTLTTSYTTAQMSSIFPENDVDVYKILYKTNDINGNLDTASGALLIPVNFSCDYFPLINYNHGTVFDKMDVPSRLYEITAGQLFSSHGFVTTMPDYLGMGDARGIHPYQHAESEATATLDMIRASREFLTQMGKNLNGEVFLTGYSQGGHACMATHKYIQENNLYSEFNVLSSIPMSGAYDMSVTTANTIFTSTYSNPGYVVYLINSMDMAHGPLYDSVQQYFKQPYANQVESWINGTYSLNTINNTFPDSIHLYLQDSVLTGFQTNPNHPLKLAVAQNDVYQWAPSRDIKMFYCTADEQVPYQNTLKARDTMIARGATSVSVFNGGNQNHAGCVQPSFINGFGHVDPIATDCTPVAGLYENELAGKIYIYPNPSTSGFMNFSSDVAIKQIDVYNGLGQLIWSRKIKNKMEMRFDVSEVESGTYFASFTTLNNSKTTKIITIKNK